MKTLYFYEAEDGTIFNDEIKCLNYEFILKNPEIYSIKITNEYAENINFCTNPFSDRNYNDAWGIMIPDDAFEAFLALSKDCGWCEFYEQIDSPGKWVRTEDFNGGIWTKQ